MVKSYKEYLPEKSQIDTLNPDLEKYKEDIPGFFTNILKINLTKDQSLVADSINKNQVTVVPSAHGMGKTCLGAGLLLWWVFCKQGLAISTAPTARQVKELLWGELRRFYDSYPFGGRRGQLFVELDESARAFGFTASPHQGSDSFQGIHSNRGLLIVIDESNGVLPSIIDGAESCITGSNDKLLLIGNPISPGTPFEAFTKRRAGVVRIPAWNHPNISWAYQEDADGIHRLKPSIAKELMPNGDLLPEDSWPQKYKEKIKIPGAVSIRWIETIARPRGEGSAFWEGRVEGRFPQDAANSIVPRSWFEQARIRYKQNPKEWDDSGILFTWRYGLDVADGVDHHALAGWLGATLKFAELLPSKGDRRDTSRAAGLGLRELRKTLGAIAVDSIGIGAGALSEILGDLPQKCVAIGFNAASKPNKPIRFVNKKAEAFWSLREAFDEGTIAVDLPDDIAEQLADDLSGIRYDELPNGRIKIEDKDIFRKLYGRSPDLADAVAMAFSLPATSQAQQRNSKTVGGSRPSSGILRSW